MKVFLISLPDSRERRRSGIAKLQSIGLPFEIVDGVEARKYLPTAIPVGKPENEHSPSLGEIGCYAAHLRALQRIVDYWMPWGIILEDDFCFEPEPDFGFQEIANVLPRKFHYIHLQRNLGFNPRCTVLADEGLFQRISETPLGGVGYVMSRPLAEYVLQHHPLCCEPIDELYARLARRGLFYQPKKPLVGVQLGLESDIWPGRAN
jgi:glycosyl transferase, family 25